jgi:hypothetical protein
MSKKFILGLSALVVLGAAGCNSSEGDLSKADAERLKNPSKTIPPEALEGMAKQGEMMKKQMEANKAANVDSRGIPIPASGGDKAPAPNPAVGPK